MKPTVCIMYTNTVHRTESLILQTNLVVTLSYFLARDTEVNSFRQTQVKWSGGVCGKEDSLNSIERHGSFIQ